jgi:hypothetical protein
LFAPTFFHGLGRKQKFLQEMNLSAFERLSWPSSKSNEQFRPGQELPFQLVLEHRSVLSSTHLSLSSEASTSFSDA